MMIGAGAKTVTLEYVACQACDHHDPDVDERLLEPVGADEEQSAKTVGHKASAVRG